MRPFVTDRAALVCLSVCHTSEPCKNGWTDQDAVWVVGLDGPKELCIGKGVQIPHGKGQFWEGKGRPVLKYRDTLRWAVQKGWTDGDAAWVVDSNGPKESCVRRSPEVLRDVAMATIFWLSVYGEHIGATWRIRLNRSCMAAMWPYVKLLWPLVYIRA